MAADIQIMAEEIIKTRARLNDIYAEHTGQVNCTRIRRRRRRGSASASALALAPLSSFIEFKRFSLPFACCCWRCCRHRC